MNITFFGLFGSPQIQAYPYCHAMKLNGLLKHIQKRRHGGGPRSDVRLLLEDSVFVTQNGIRPHPPKSQGRLFTMALRKLVAPGLVTAKEHGGPKGALRGGW